MKEARFVSDVVIYRSMIAIAADDSPDNTQADRIARSPKRRINCFR